MSFDLVHVRAVLMHIPDRMAVLRRLAPGGWLVAEDSRSSVLGDAARLGRSGKAASGSPAPHSRDAPDRA
jgi:hypothetical protein